VLIERQRPEQVWAAICRVEDFIFAVRQRSDAKDQILLIRVVLFGFVETRVDAEGLAVVFDLLNQDCHPGRSVASAEDHLILHDAEDLFVRNLPQVFDRHEARVECREQNPEAGDELVTGFEVLEFHLSYLL